MKTVCLTPSANWYSGGALASDGAQLLVGCARQALLLAGPAPRPAGAAPSLRCHGIIDNAHQERATGAVVWRPPAKPVSLVSCGEDGVVKLWHCQFTEEDSQLQYRCEKQHNAHGKLKVAAVAHAARAPHVAITVDERGTFVVWDTVAHTTRTLFLERLAATELRCSPHTEHVVAVAGRRGVLWTVSLAASGRILQKLRGHDDDVTSISWCPELTTLLSFEQDHLLVSASKDKTLRVWGTRGGRCHVTQRVPTPDGGGRRQTAGGGGERAWLAVLWTQADCLYSSGLAGQLLRWRLTGDGDNCQVVHRSHGRSLFNIVRLGQLVVSSGIERQLVVHDPGTLLTGAVPCLGGQAAALDTCPVDPGRLAIACGDQTIRVWNLSADVPYSMATVWQGIKAKVLTVAWHPEKDSRLAFGTDEGRVGVCDPSSSRPPQLCPEHHAGPVYSVSWSAAGQLFSLSLGAVWRHDAARLAAAVWAPAAGRAACSQLRWGGGGAALGRQDGAVELMTSDGVRRGAALGHRRLVTALCWKPAPEQDGTTTLAVASYDSFVSVFDVPDLGGSACPDLLQARVTLTGHKSRVLDLAWLSHTTSQLVSASQDATVRVWDTVSGAVLAVYGGHRRPVRCCLPHPLLPGRVFTGGDDCTLHLWDIDQQDNSLPEKVLGESAVAEPATGGKEKGRSRVRTAGHASAATLIVSDGSDDRISTASAAQPRELGDGRKTRTQRSLFPLTGAAENRGKAHSQADLEYLMAPGDASASDGQNWKHLGLFSDDAALRETIDMEMMHHESQQSAAQLLQMSLWRGDTATVVSRAAAEARLTDELLTLAPMVSYRFWEEMSAKYAEQLENSKECLKASSVLLACHKVTEAISLLVRHALYREALCVSRLRLAPTDPSHGRILRLWAEQLVTDGNMEQAAKCYLSLGDRAAAAGVLSRRSDPGSLRLAARLWSSAGDSTQARALALLCLHASCLRADWDVGVAMAREVPAVAAGLHLCVAHRVLVTELESIKERLFAWAAGILRRDQPASPAPPAERQEQQEQEQEQERSAGGLVERVRQAWQTVGVESGTGSELKQGLQEVAYRTMPTSPKQLWLGVSSELCLAALDQDTASSDARLLKILALCQQSVPAQLPTLCALLVPAATGGVWETGRQYVLSAVLSVLHQRALHAAATPPAASNANGAEVVPSVVGGEQSQCTTPPTDGSNEALSDQTGLASDGTSATNAADCDPVSASAESSVGDAVSAGSALSAMSAGPENSDMGAVSAAPADGGLAECVRVLGSLYIGNKTREEERMFAELEQRLKAI